MSGSGRTEVGPQRRLESCAGNPSSSTVRPSAYSTLVRGDHNGEFGLARLGILSR